MKQSGLTTSKTSYFPFCGTAILPCGAFKFSCGAAILPCGTAIHPTEASGLVRWLSREAYLPMVLFKENARSVKP